MNTYFFAEILFVYVASTGMVRLRMHRQIEVTGREPYLHLYVAAKLCSTYQPSDNPLFKLHYVELGTSSFRSATEKEGTLFPCPCSCSLNVPQKCM